MTFYALHEGFYEGVQSRIDLLGNACRKKGIDFVVINSLTFDYTKLPHLTNNDLLYNFARGSQTLESLLLNDEVITYYIITPTLISIRSMTEWSIIHEKVGLPAPKTIYHLTTDRNLLQKYVTYLSGFPVVLKVMGGTRGIGTLKVESWPSLYSVVDYLVTTGDDFIIREFIDANFGARVMVLGERVIASAKFFLQENDFRNAPILDSTRYEPISLTKEMEEICIQAVRVANLEMAGVDLLFDRAGNPYLLEINFPTGFQALIDVCGVDVPAKMVQYLINKSLQTK